MHDAMKRNAGEGRRGGDLFATLLFVVGVFVFSAVAFVLTDALMGSKDTTMAFVPMSATTYVHSDGYASTEALLSSSTEMPAGIHPYEFALFIAPGDDAPQRGIVLAWSALKKPNAEELAVLKERGATQLDGRHYFFGDSALATAAKVAAAAHVSLSDDAVRRGALNAARALFSVQIMTNPRAAIGAIDSPLFADLLGDISPETTIVGISLREGSFIARVTPLSVIMSDGIVRGGTGDLDPERIGADAALTEAAPDFGISKLFAFGDGGEVGVTRDALAKSDEALRAALNSPFVLWLRQSTDAQQPPTFLLHFPRVSTAVAKAAVAQNFAIRNPSSQNLTLPDGDFTSELLVKNAFGSGTTAGGDLTLGNESGKVIVGTDGNGGSLIGSAPSILADYRNSPRLAQNQAKDPCGRLENKLTLNNLDIFREKIPPFSYLVERMGVNTVSFGRSVGNELFFCGYKK